MIKTYRISFEVNQLDFYLLELLTTIRNNYKWCSAESIHDFLTDPEYDYGFTKTLQDVESRLFALAKKAILVTEEMSGERAIDDNGNQLYALNPYLDNAIEFMLVIADREER